MTPPIPALRGAARFVPTPFQLPAPPAPPEGCAPVKVDRRRETVNDRWTTSTQLTVASGSDLVAALVADAGFDPEVAKLDADGALKAQLQGRVLTALRLEVRVVALEDTGGSVFVYAPDLSEALTEALEELEVEVYGDDSETPALAAQPLHHFRLGVVLREDLRVRVRDKNFHLALKHPEGLRVLNPDHATKVTATIRAIAVFEDPPRRKKPTTAPEPAAEDTPTPTLRLQKQEPAPPTLIPAAPRRMLPTSLQKKPPLVLDFDDEDADDEPEAPRWGSGGTDDLGI